MFTCWGGGVRGEGWGKMFTRVATAMYFIYCIFLSICILFIDSWMQECSDTKQNSVHFVRLQIVKFHCCTVHSEDD